MKERGERLSRLGSLRTLRLAAAIRGSGVSKQPIPAASAPLPLVGAGTAAVAAMPEPDFYHTRMRPEFSFNADGVQKEEMDGEYELSTKAIHSLAMSSFVRRFGGVAISDQYCHQDELDGVAIDVLSATPVQIQRQLDALARGSEPYFLKDDEEETIGYGAQNSFAALKRKKDAGIAVKYPITIYNCSLIDGNHYVLHEINIAHEVAQPIITEYNSLNYSSYNARSVALMDRHCHQLSEYPGESVKVKSTDRLMQSDIKACGVLANDNLRVKLGLGPHCVGSREELDCRDGVYEYGARALRADFVKQVAEFPPPGLGNSSFRLYQAQHNALCTQDNGLVAEQLGWLMEVIGTYAELNVLIAPIEAALTSRLFTYESDTDVEKNIKMRQFSRWENLFNRMNVDIANPAAGVEEALIDRVIYTDLLSEFNLPQNYTKEQAQAEFNSRIAGYLADRSVPADELPTLAPINPPSSARLNPAAPLPPITPAEKSPDSKELAAAKQFILAKFGPAATSSDINGFGEMVQLRRSIDELSKQNLDYAPDNLISAYERASSKWWAIQEAIKAAQDKEFDFDDVDGSLSTLDARNKEEVHKRQEELKVDSTIMASFASSEADEVFFADKEGIHVQQTIELLLSLDDIDDKIKDVAAKNLITYLDKKRASELVSAPEAPAPAEEVGEQVKTSDPVVPKQSDITIEQYMKSLGYIAGFTELITNARKSNLRAGDLRRLSRELKVTRDYGDPYDCSSDPLLKAGIFLIDEFKDTDDPQKYLSDSEKKEALESCLNTLSEFVHDTELQGWYDKAREILSNVKAIEAAIASSMPAGSRVGTSSSSSSASEDEESTSMEAEGNPSPDYQKIFNDLTVRSDIEGARIKFLKECQSKGHSFVQGCIDGFNGLSLESNPSQGEFRTKFVRMLSSKLLTPKTQTLNVSGQPVADQSEVVRSS